tara:strand:+ start:216 stop:389 length:174 start_codon:yes stop_codon:yes gene_type:complete
MKTYQQFNESLKIGIIKVGMLEFLMRIKLPLRLYDKMIVLNRVSLLNQNQKVNIQVD